MSDPRADVNFVGIGYRAETFKIDNSTITYVATSDNGSAEVGRAVNLSAAETVQLAPDGGHIIGKLIEVFSDNYCTVQTKGYCTLPGGNSASLTIGKAIVGAASSAPANGYIREVATATAAELGLCSGKIIDAGTTTAVVVDLG